MFKYKMYNMKIVVITVSALIFLSSCYATKEERRAAKHKPKKARVSCELFPKRVIKGKY